MDQKSGFLIMRVKERESVQVGETTVCVAKISGNSIKLAFKGPKNVPIKRIGEEHEAQEDTDTGTDQSG